MDSRREGREEGKCFIVVVDCLLQTERDSIHTT